MRVYIQLVQLLNRYVAERESGCFEKLRFAKSMYGVTTTSSAHIWQVLTL